MITEKIKLVLVKRNMSKSQLADKLGWSASNLHNKMKRDNFSEKELLEIAKALDCNVELNIVLSDTGEKF